MERRWYSRLLLAKEYCAGIIAGCGLGILLMAALDHYMDRPGWSLRMVLGLLLIPIGSMWQRYLASRGTAEQ